MDILKTIYAHRNPFTHPLLQKWQEQYSDYCWSNEGQQRATTELKAALVLASHPWRGESKMSKLLLAPRSAQTDSSPVTLVLPFSAGWDNQFTEDEDNFETEEWSDTFEW
jgi:hypothetical protein